MAAPSIRSTMPRGTHGGDALQAVVASEFDKLHSRLCRHRDQGAKRAHCDGPPAQNDLTPKRVQRGSKAQRRSPPRQEPGADAPGRLGALLLAAEASAAGADSHYCAELRTYEARRRQGGAGACHCSMADVLSSDASAGAADSTTGSPGKARGNSDMHGRGGALPPRYRAPPQCSSAGDSDGNGSRGDRHDSSNTILLIARAPRRGHNRGQNQGRALPPKSRRRGRQGALGGTAARRQGRSRRPLRQVLDALWSARFGHRAPRSDDVLTLPVQPEHGRQHQ